MFTQLYYDIELDHKKEILITEMYSLGYTSDMISWILSGFDDDSYTLLNPTLFNVNLDGLFFMNDNYLIELRLPISLFSLNLQSMQLSHPLAIVSLPDFTGDIKNLRINMRLSKLPVLPVFLKTLDLCGNNLVDVDLRYLHYLEELLIADNRLRNLWIPSLDVLDISDNPDLDLYGIDLHIRYLNIARINRLYISEHHYRML